MRLFLGIIVFLLGIIGVQESFAMYDDCTIKWSYPLDGVTTKGGFAINNDGTIYAGTSEGIVYAINPDGTLKWDLSFDITSEQAQDVDISTIPSELRDAVPPNFDISNISNIPDSLFYPGAYDRDDFSHSSPTLSSDGKILYVAGRISGTVYAIDTDNQSIIWSFNVQDIPEVRNDPLNYGGGFVSSPAIGNDGTIYIGSGDWWADQGAEELGVDTSKIKEREFSDKRLYAINPNGTLKWIFTVDDEHVKTSIFGSPVIDSNGIIFFGSFNGIFYAIRDDGDTATKVWSYDAKKSPLPNTTNRDKEFWPSPAIGNDGTIYSGNNNFHLYAFSPEDGSIKWTFETNNEVYQSATIAADGTIYQASEDGHLYAINLDGTLKWKYFSGSEDALPFTASVLNDNSIIFGMMGYNRIISLASDSSLKWQCDFGGEAEVGTSMNPAVGGDGTIYVYADSKMYAIEGTSPLSIESPWPKVDGDSRNSGYQTSLQLVDRDSDNSSQQEIVRDNEDDDYNNDYDNEREEADYDREEYDEREEADYDDEREEEDEREENYNNAKSIIPEWIRDNAKWWVEGLISDEEYISALEYLIEEGILIIP